MVKIWTDSGDVVGTLRPGNSSTLLAPHRVGAVTAMAFHAYAPVLAAAGADHCTVYELHDPQAASAAAAAAAAARAERASSLLP